jgi:hypothetical protein
MSSEKERAEVWVLNCVMYNSKHMDFTINGDNSPIWPHQSKPKTFHKNSYPFGSYFAENSGLKWSCKFLASVTCEVTWHKGLELGQ